MLYKDDEFMILSMLAYGKMCGIDGRTLITLINLRATLCIKLHYELCASHLWTGNASSNTDFFLPQRGKVSYLWKEDKSCCCNIGVASPQVIRPIIQTFAL